MKTKDNKKIYIIIVFIIILAMALLVVSLLDKSDSYATETNAKNKNVKISEAKDINLYDIIFQNTSMAQTEKIETTEETLEFLTKYKINKDLPKGRIQVLQEGREGIQQISKKKIYENGELIKEEQVGAKVIKASVDKIVEIGGANYSSNYNIKVGENIFVTSDRATLMVEPNSSSRKIATLSKDETLKVLEILEDWYKVANLSVNGWIKKESTTYIDPNAGKDTGSGGKSRQEALASLNFNMNLNKPSGLSLEQFKKVLTDDKDKNKIFENNAEYFYYIEKQYNINGLFVASIGIHESAWGTSKIARNKTNLFGYGAYDSNPYNGAYTFSSYSESIDLMARVLTKYYLNPAGTKIYNDETAKGTYYNGPTFSGVNTKYATDKNWANAVYNHMKYLYEKI